MSLKLKFKLPPPPQDDFPSSEEEPSRKKEKKSKKKHKKEKKSKKSKTKLSLKLKTTAAPPESSEDEAEWNGPSFTSAGAASANPVAAPAPSTKVTTEKKQVVRPMENDGAVYCVCKKPMVPNALYLGCEECEGWFHPECVGYETCTRIDHNEPGRVCIKLTPHAHVDVSEGEFLCPSCTRTGFAQWREKFTGSVRQVNDPKFYFDKLLRDQLKRDQMKKLGKTIDDLPATVSSDSDSDPEPVLKRKKKTKTKPDTTGKEAESTPSNKDNKSNDHKHGQQASSRKPEHIARAGETDAKTKPVARTPPPAPKQPTNKTTNSSNHGLFDIDDDTSESSSDEASKTSALATKKPPTDNRPLEQRPKGEDELTEAMYIASATQPKKRRVDTHGKEVNPSGPIALFSRIPITNVDKENVKEYVDVKAWAQITADSDIGKAKDDAAPLSDAIASLSQSTKGSENEFSETVLLKLWKASQNRRRAQEAREKLRHDREAERLRNRQMALEKMRRDVELAKEKQEQQKREEEEKKKKWEQEMEMEREKARAEERARRERMIKESNAMEQSGNGDNSGEDDDEDEDDEWGF